MFNWFRKPADTDMQTMQVDPRTEDTLAKAKREARLDEIRSGIRLALTAERDAAWIALREIASLETPGSAPAAKRMARIAREALPEYAAADREAA